ncbi:hypothetical protein BJX64DRAFT_283016 [Aspergillus heterothallicus]
MEQQCMRMEKELEKHYGKEDWSMTFRAGPDSIGILAECILITARPRVRGIEIPGLKFKALSANVLHCAEIGSETFRETAKHMDLLAELTDELSMPGGLIDTMLKFSEPGQSQDRDDVLADIIAEGEQSITHCMGAIEMVSASFKGWCELTKSLHLALQETLGRKDREKDAVKNDIKKHEADKEVKEEQRRKNEEKMRAKHEEMQKTREKKEWYENTVQKIVKGNPLSIRISPAVLAAPEVASVVPVVAAVGAVGAIAFLHYVTLKADLSSMEEAQAKRDEEIRELEQSKAELEATLAQLSEDSKSIVEIAHIVGDSIQKVTELQQLIQKFMDFLSQIFKIIGDTRFLKMAFEMKTRFIFASKASSVYNAVSSQFILPTLNILPGLGCPNHTAEYEIQARIDEIHRMRCAVGAETDSLTRQMHKELKESQSEMTRACARAFEELLPEDQDAAA